MTSLPLVSQILTRQSIWRNGTDTNFQNFDDENDDDDNEEDDDEEEEKEKYKMIGHYHDVRSILLFTAFKCRIDLTNLKVGKDYVWFYDILCQSKERILLYKDSDC